MRAVVGLLAASLVSLVAGVSKADIGPWIEAHPKIAYSIKWQDEREIEPGYYVTERGKVRWEDWSDEQKQDLEDAYAETYAWYHSGDPFGDLDESIQYPPTNLLDTSNDNGSPYTNVTEDYAWDMYIRWVAQTLLVEYEGHFPWSILDYDTEQLKVLLDSTSMFARISTGLYSVGTGSPGHGNYIRRAGNVGDVIPAPPRYTYAFLSNEDLLGSSRLDTIVRVLDWGSQNLVHFYGSSSYGNYEAHWQYRGSPPITRIIEGTVRDSESTPEHWTAGCHGTTGFLRNVLRAANIPVQIANRCDHSQAYFMSEGLYLDHGDDIYNLTFKSLGVSSENLLISEATHALWFGDNPDNNSDYCDTGIGRQVDILAGTGEICGDGVDNDDDGDLECADSDCYSTAQTLPDKIIAGDAAYRSAFGMDLALDGDTLLIGTWYDGNKAYVYTRGATGGWSEQAKLTANTPDVSFTFGDELALEGDTAFVAGTDGDLVGSVHVFSRSGTTWSEDAILQASDAHEEGRFGTDLDVEGNTLVVGSMGHMFSSGAAYVFEKSGGAWQEVQKIEPSDSVDDDWFGHGVALEDDLLVIGAPSRTEAEVDQGFAYVFRKSGGTWVEEAKLGPSTADYAAYFGQDVATSGGRILIGAHQESLDGFTGAGAAYVFDRDPQTGTWSETARLVSPNQQDFSNFGWSLSFRGDRAVIGAVLEYDLLGSAYAFDWDGSDWNVARELKAPEGISWDTFGNAVAHDDDWILVAADGDPSQGENTGAVYAFNLAPTRAGQCVAVEGDQTGNQDVTLTFSTVLNPGTTMVESSSSGPALPGEFSLGSPPTYYEISTTTEYEGPVQVCIDYSGASYESEIAITLLHYENGAWVDLCEDEARCALDTAADVICAWTDTLSPFAVAEGPLADLSLAQAISRTHDGHVNVTLTLKNLGPDAAGQVTVTDALPAGINYNSCSATAGGICDADGNDVAVYFDSLASGQTATITIAGCTVSASAMTNVATAYSERATDPNFANNAAMKQLAAPSSLPAVQLANGDMKYAVTFPATQAFVEAFVRVNGVQTVAGNIVGSRVNNADGTYTYSRTVSKSQYKAGDVINVRFYSYRSGQPGVYTPGPIEWLSYPDFVYGSGSTSCQSVCRPTYAQLPNGDVKTAYTFSSPRNYVEAFVRKNSTVVASGNIVQSGIANFDGTFTYSRVTSASQFSSGAQVSFRFYSYVNGGPQIFTPGPTQNTWLAGFKYNQAPTSDCQ